MKEFILVRHAKSSWKEPGLSDIERPLNKRGKRDAPRMAAYLREISLIPDYIATSPAVRAYTTASHFRTEFNDELEGFEIFQDLYFGSEEDILYIIKDMDNDINLPAIFSHNPTLTYLSNRFVGASIDNVPTCGVVHLRSDADNWKDVYTDNTRLVSTYFPKLIPA